VGGLVIFAVAFSILVALFWLKWFRKLDKYEKEPERFVYLVFFAGVLATIPSVILEIPIQLGTPNKPLPINGLFLSFLWVGAVEEFFKYLAVRLTVYRSNQFNEVMDGMIYMISAALGFAAAENVGYMMGVGFFVGVLRAILSYLGHVSFSAILGYYLGKAKIEGQRNWLWIGFIWAISLHWLYDTFFVIGTSQASVEFILLGLMVWVFGLSFTLHLAKRAQRVSPFRTAHILPKRLTRQCQACGKRVSVKAWICHHCGEPLNLEEEELILKA
jgi:RsiW-degrading membrane proteinase PrsW (M82 family)